MKSTLLFALILPIAAASSALACPAGQTQVCGPLGICACVPTSVPPAPDLCINKKELIIRNQTDNSVNYSLDGTSSTLEAGYYSTWTICGDFANIDFDYSFQSGYQGKSYGLDACGVAFVGKLCSYSFTEVSNGLELYKDE
jgi:hypothetical protein